MQKSKYISIEITMSNIIKGIKTPRIGSCHYSARGFYLYYIIVSLYIIIVSALKQSLNSSKIYNTLRRSEPFQPQYKINKIITEKETINQQ